MQKLAAARECLRVLPILASLQSSLFVSQKQSLKQALLNSSDDQARVDCLFFLVDTMNEMF